MIDRVGEFASQNIVATCTLDMFCFRKSDDAEDLRCVNKASSWHQLLWNDFIIDNT